MVYVFGKTRAISLVCEQLGAERDENRCREDMRPSEKVALGKALEALERPKAKARQGHGETAPGKNASENFTEALGQTRDIVGAELEWSGVTYQRLERPKAKARREDGASVREGRPSENFTEGPLGQTRDIVGAELEWSGV